MIEVALIDHAELEKELRAIVPDGQAELRSHSDYRNFSILEIVCSSVTAGVVGLVFDTLKEHVKNRLSSGRTAAERAVSIRIGQVSVQISGDTDAEALEDIFARLREAASSEPDDAADH
ncbi:hypothetical protein ACPCTO_36480 [Streptomyces olivoreticuli]